MYSETSLLFFDIPLLYYYFNLKSSIISGLFSADIYLSLGISLSFSFVTVSKLFISVFSYCIINVIKLISILVDHNYIDSPDWIKNKKATINPINKKDNQCFSTCYNSRVKLQRNRKTR